MKTTIEKSDRYTLIVSKLEKFISLPSKASNNERNDKGTP